MKGTTQSLSAIAFVAIAAFSSCKKNNDNTSTLEQVTAVDKSNVSMFSALKSTPQTFTVSAGASTKIKAAEGTLLEFYPNSFKDKNGNVITSGSITLQVTEMYKAGDMIANRTTTTTDDGVLTSGGEVNIKATMGGQEVFANSYRLGFKAAAAAPTKPMELYYGDANNEDSITSWSPRKLAVAGTNYVTDTSWNLMEAPYYMFDGCTSFNMINCDHPYDATSKYVTISVTFPDNTFRSEYGSLAMVYPSLNVVTTLRANQFNSASHTMTFKGWAPTGQSCKFVLMIPKNVNEWYYSERSGTASGDMSIDANVTLTSKADVMSKLHAL